MTKKTNFVDSAEPPNMLRFDNRDNPPTLVLFVADEITVIEPAVFQIIMWEAADLRALFSVVAALASGVVQYAEERGILN